MTVAAENSPFWDWAVAAYGGEGIAAKCLSLQDDHGQCVPYLLWAIWTGIAGANLSADLAEAGADMARSWSETVIAPLRAIRKKLRLPVSDMDDEARMRLREQIKGVELQSERELMLALESLSDPDFSNIKQNLVDICAGHVIIAAKAWDKTVPRAPLMSLVEALSAGRFLEYNQS